MRLSDSLSDAFDDPAEDPDLEREFPLGDGTADMSTTVACPYCSEVVEISLDPGSGDDQDYVEDCEVCCRPWQVAVTYDGSGKADVSIQALDE